MKVRLNKKTKEELSTTPVLGTLKTKQKQVEENIITYIDEPFLKPENIRYGISICGITGTYCVCIDCNTPITDYPDSAPSPLLCPTHFYERKCALCKINGVDSPGCVLSGKYNNDTIKYFCTEEHKREYESASHGCNYPGCSNFVYRDSSCYYGTELPGNGGEVFYYCDDHYGRLNICWDHNWYGWSDSCPQCSTITTSYEYMNGDYHYVVKRNSDGEELSRNEESHYDYGAPTCICGAEPHLVWDGNATCSYYYMTQEDAENCGCVGSSDSGGSSENYIGECAHCNQSIYGGADDYQSYNGNYYHLDCLTPHDYCAHCDTGIYGADDYVSCNRCGRMICLSCADSDYCTIPRP